MAEYAVVKPITSCQKKAHAKAQNLSQPQPIKETECAQEEASQPIQTPAHETQAVHDNVVDEPMEIIELAVQESMANPAQVLLDSCHNAVAQDNLQQAQTQELMINLAQVLLDSHHIAVAQENFQQAQTQDTPNQEQAPSAQDNGRPRRKVQTKLAAVTKPSCKVLPIMVQGYKLKRARHYDSNLKDIEA
ncbi:hypothetical protein DSO57_1029629 [Entomophthora muscae]|uniref:Uncharacterized protein n=1 Tax=Entomophthora muscae TaxID=34485 RepID=A0ACC2UBH4_9FUNG|nr:hypothetical protein DSO57_1029629 [Entomophthora muscae]